MVVEIRVHTPFVGYPLHIIFNPTSTSPPFHIHFSTHSIKMIISVVSVLILVPSCYAASSTKLWELGEGVNDNPLTTFIMFAMVVAISVLVEAAKHTAESKIKDKYRRESLQAVYTELMMVGVVSALLILTAELGLLDVRIGCDSPPPPPVPLPTLIGTPETPLPDAGSAVASSGSGSEPCGLGFDLILFEYAHLVLFFMGLVYCLFIMVALFARDIMCAQIAKLQEKRTMHEWYHKGDNPDSTLGIMGWALWDEGQWARAVLTFRAGLIQQHGKRMIDICNPARDKLMRDIPRFRALPVPTPLPTPDRVTQDFDIARFSYIAMSEVLLELLHIPPIAWLCVLVVASANLIHKAGLELSHALLVTGVFGPLLAFLVVWRISVHFSYLSQRASGHPNLPKYEFREAHGRKASKIDVAERYKKEGQAWSKGGEDPWEILTGCCEDGSTFDSLDPLDPGALERQIQVVLLSLCFYMGQLAMLAKLVFSDLGALGALCFLVPLPALFWWLPRAILIYALTHRSKECPDTWLEYALKKVTDPEDEPAVKTKLHSNDEEAEMIKRETARRRRRMHSQPYQASAASELENVDEMFVHEHPLVADRAGRGGSFPGATPEFYSPPPSSVGTPAMGPSRYISAAYGGSRDGGGNGAFVPSQAPLIPVSHKNYRKPRGAF